MLKHQELITKVIYDFQINITRKKKVLYWKKSREGKNESGSFIKEVVVDLHLNEKVEL